MASSSSSPPPSNTFNYSQVNWVPTFKVEKYQQWAMQMKSIFISQYLWDLVQYGYEQPINVAQEATWNGARKLQLKQNLIRDNYALSLIYCGMDLTILPTIMAATTAKEAWIILETKYRGLEKSYPKSLEILDMLLDNCCIYKVPEFIVKGREDFYQPKVMSIGPVYYNKDPKLETMQEIKWIFLNYFLQLADDAHKSVDPYIDFVSVNEEKICRSYHQESTLSRDEFVEMMVLDAAFLVYFIIIINRTMLPCEEKSYVNNKLLALLSYSAEDLLKLENQIPYFVLKGIYGIAFGDDDQSNTNLLKATLEFIGNVSGNMPGSKAIERINNDGYIITIDTRVEHLLDLQWMCCCLSLRNQPNRNDLKEKIKDDARLLRYTAKQLKDAGVTFEAGETKNNNPLDITFDNGKLTISKLNIQDSTETHRRNLVYFEQCHYYYKEVSYFIAYVIFLDQLIDTVEDVQVLVENGIFINHLGSDKDVVNLFNNIGKNVISKDENYNFDVSYDLNCYASHV